MAKRDGKLYMMQVKGVPTTIALQNGKTLKNVKAKGKTTPVCQNIYLLTQQEAEHLFLSETLSETLASPVISKVKEPGRQRTIVKGKAKVAEAPSEADWQQAAVYRIQLPSQLSDSECAHLLRIDYQGDCARLYANGKLVADNFQYGRPFLYGLWRLPQGTTELELRIVPLQADAPIYLPREADKTPGEGVKSITITKTI